VPIPLLGGCHMVLQSHTITGYKEEAH